MARDIIHIQIQHHMGKKIKIKKRKSIFPSLQQFLITTSILAEVMFPLANAKFLVLNLKLIID